MEEAVFGGGCFWCVQAVFERIEGVVSATAGFAGGAVANPTYKQVCSGTTGHAEVVLVKFDPVKVPYQKLLQVFWLAHDPTTLNRQGADIGTQYRSIILYTNDAQREIAQQALDAAQKERDGKIVTVIEPLKAFYPAEEYHQEYYNKNSGAPYCNFVIAPKLKKLGLLK